jgi:uncharacterized membrane protein
VRNLRGAYWAAAAFAVVLFAYDLNRLYALRYGADLGTFLQTLVNWRHGSTFNYGEWRPHLQVHDSWALIALVPLIAVFPRAETLLAIQVLAVASAAIPLALLGRELGLSPRAATIVAIAFLLTPSAQGLAYDNFSENVFVPVLAFSGVLAVVRNAWWPAILLAIALCGIKEDSALFVVWFGAACAIWRDRRLGAAICAAGLVTLVAYWSIEQVLGVHPNDPPYGFAVHDVSGKFTLTMLLLAPFAFAPLAVGRWLWLAVPLLVEIVFMQPWNYEASRIGSHYTAPLLAAASVAAIAGVRRFPKLVPAIVPCALLVTLVIFSDTALRPGRWPYIVDWKAYGRAVAARESTVPVLLPRREEGVWAVAASNPLVRLDLRRDPDFVACPAYDTDARAFFDSLRGVMPARLCGGVPVR